MSHGVIIHVPQLMGSYPQCFLGHHVFRYLIKDQAPEKLGLKLTQIDGFSSNTNTSNKARFKKDTPDGIKYFPNLDEFRNVLLEALI